MKRYDYRRKYSDMSLEELEQQLSWLQDKYLQNIGVCEENYKNYYKNYCYVKNRIEKLKSHG